MVVEIRVIVSVGVEMTLSKRAASFGDANAFNCFPKFKIVSWHSANFSEAAVISQFCQIDQESTTIYMSHIKQGLISFSMQNQITRVIM